MTVPEPFLTSQIEAVRAAKLTMRTASIDIVNALDSVASGVNALAAAFALYAKVTATLEAGIGERISAAAAKLRELETPPPSEPAKRAPPNFVRHKVIAFVENAGRPVTWKEFCREHPDVLESSANACFARMVEIGRFTRDKYDLFEVNPNFGKDKAPAPDSGQLTGHGADFIVVDDPHIIPRDQLKTTRVNTEAWWDETIASRLDDPITRPVQATVPLSTGGALGVEVVQGAAATEIVQITSNNPNLDAGAATRMRAVPALIAGHAANTDLLNP